MAAALERPSGSVTVTGSATVTVTDLATVMVTDSATVMVMDLASGQVQVVAARRHHPGRGRSGGRWCPPFGRP